MQSYWEDYIVDFRDVDRGYHIKFPQLLEVLGTISTKHTNSVGIDPYYLHSKGLAWILYEWKVEMIRTQLYARPIRIETFGTDKRGMYFMRYFGIYDEEGSIIGRGYSKWVVIDLQKRRIAKIPNEVLEAFQFNRNETSETQDRIMKLPDSTPRTRKMEEVERKVCHFPLRYYDIDPNGHVNNVKYLEWAIESLHGEGDFLDAHVPKTVSVVYKKEKSPEGEVVCSFIREDMQTYHEISSTEGELLTVIEICWKEK